MRKFISSIPASSVLTSFTTAITTAIGTFLPFKINLTNEEKTGTRSMAEGREGYARLLSRIANQFPNSLSRVDEPKELSNLLAYYDELEANRLAVLQALETVDEIQLGAATDIMTLVDRYNSNLQISRANEGSLDMAMKEVDEYNSRFANKKPEVDKPVL